MGFSTTYPTSTFRLPSPAKWRDTAFFWLSWDRARVSRARRTSFSRTGLANRKRWTSVSLTARTPSAHHRLTTDTGTGRSLDGTACCSTPMILPVRLPGWVAVLARVTSTCSPRAWVRIWARDGELFRLMANDARVRSMGSWLSYVTAATRPVGDRSRRVIDLIR